MNLFKFPTAVSSLLVASALTLDQSAFADGNPLVSGETAAIPRTAFLFANPETGQTGQYGNSGTATISNFPPEMWGKQVMILMGSDFTSEDASQSTIYGKTFFKNTIVAQRDPSQRPFDNYTQRVSEFGRKANISRECLALKISANMPLNITSPDPSLCEVEPQNEKEYLVRGFACFIEIAPLMGIHTTAQVHPSCAKAQAYQGEIFGTVGYFTAGDASGHSSELTTIGLTRYRLTIDAPPKLPRQMSYTAQAPAWPTRIVLDMHLAKVSLQVSEQGTEILPFVMLDNRCGGENQMSAWADSSVCHFAAPFGAQILFSQQQNGVWRTSDAWYGGLVVTPQWKGVTPVGQHRSPVSVQVGRRYRISMDANYPDTYYRLAQKQNAQWLINAHLPNINTNADILATLSPISTIGDGSNGRIASVPIIDVPAPNLRKGAFGNLTRHIDNLNALVGMSDVWPPFLQDVCDVTQTSCQQLGKFQQMAEIEFTVKQINADGTVGLDNYIVRRNSNLAAQRSQIETTSLPNVDVRWFE